ncbi:MAG TPA: serine/threonine-protein kinase [Polyangia bacterium]|nr:serine/threonine-protein kinase [Polyangia bacterium]
MFAALYVNGHLFTAAFSLAMALAFALSALRVPGARSDFWFSSIFTLTGSGALVEMLLVTHPSLWWARGYLGLMIILYLTIVIGLHDTYGPDVLSRGERRWWARGVIVYAIWAAAIEASLFSGAFDHGATRTPELWGVRSTVCAVTVSGYLALQAFSLANLVLLGPLLLRRGPRRGERRMVAVPILLAPLVAVHEILVAFGVGPSIPLGGYFTALAGLVGAFVLAERFRALAHGGSLVGHYLVERRIGGGGMADVFAARRIGSGDVKRVMRRVALKRLRPEFNDDPAFVHMFLDEARIVARLSHPNIVTLHDVGQSRGELYLAMELVDGPTLSRLLKVSRARRRPIDPDVAAEIGVRLADALAYAHAAVGEDGRSLELIHRDVSPQNVLLTVDGHVKLADFGIARSALHTVHTATGVLKGKLSYMAPEQIQGLAYGQQVDLYAVGVVLYELVTGARPFEGDSEQTMLRDIVAGELQRSRALERAPEALRQVIAAALDPDPGRRPAGARSLHAQLVPLRDEAQARAKLQTLVQLAMEDDERQRQQEDSTVAERRLN